MSLMHQNPRALAKKFRKQQKQFDAMFNQFLSSRFGPHFSHFGRSLSPFGNFGTPSLLFDPYTNVSDSEDGFFTNTEDESNDTATKAITPTSATTNVVN
eukprot:UN08592